MLERITKIITHFFGIIAGSLSGISAILIAIGFLAERSHLKMLGFTTIPVDLNQYLYTGASLIGFLPGIIILQSISLLTKPLSLIIVAVILVIWISMQFGKMNDIWQRLFKLLHQMVAKFTLVFLILFLFVQILTLNWMIRAITVENLLFTEVSATPQNEFTFLNADDNSLKYLLTSQDEESEVLLRRYYTQLFLITIAIGLVLRYLTFLGKENHPEIPFYMRFWLVLNFLLFATQVFLLPGNYGVLLLNNKYQEVKVQFVSKDNNVSASDRHLVALKNSQIKTENKIRDQELELFGGTFVYDLEAVPKVFAIAHGSELNYKLKVNNPAVVQAEINKTILLVNPLKIGKTQISINATNNEGTIETTRFNISVVDEINKMGALEANPIPPKKLVIGEDPFIKDLSSEPFVFSLLDSEPVHLTYQAISSSTNVADVEIKNSILTVTPYSKGSSEITIIANDGYGRMINSVFEITVFGQTLEWPADESLLLLYQSGDVFYLYSKHEKRIWHVRNEDIESMVFYGLIEVFKFN